MYNLLVSSNDDVPIRIGNFQIKNNKREKLLGIQFNKKLSFSYHLSEICKKASKKLYALGRVTACLYELTKKKDFNECLFEQFSYCPLMWICHSCIINKTKTD